MTTLTTAWMLGCVCGFFLGVTVASRRRPTCRELMRDRQPSFAELLMPPPHPLTRWGHPTPQPVAVSERLPRPEDCTAQGWCWVFYRGFATWTLEKPLGQDGKHTGYTHWLPANALPTPEAQ